MNVRLTRLHLFVFTLALGWLAGCASDVQPSVTRSAPTPTAVAPVSTSDGRQLPPTAAWVQPNEGPVAGTFLSYALTNGLEFNPHGGEIGEVAAASFLAGEPVDIVVNTTTVTAFRAQIVAGDPRYGRSVASLPATGVAAEGTVTFTLEQPGYEAEHFLRVRADFDGPSAGYAEYVWRLLPVPGSAPAPRPMPLVAGGPGACHPPSAPPAATATPAADTDWAELLRQTAPETLAAEADLILVGETEPSPVVSRSWTSFISSGADLGIVTDTGVTVECALLGSPPAATLGVRTEGGCLGEACMAVAHGAQLEPGRRMVLFLRRLGPEYVTVRTASDGYEIQPGPDVYAIIAEDGAYVISGHNAAATPRHNYSLAELMARIAAGVEASRLPLIVGVIEPAPGAPTNFEEAAEQAESVALADVTAVSAGPLVFFNAEKTYCEPYQFVTVRLVEVYKGDLIAGDSHIIYHGHTGVTDMDGGCLTNPAAEKVRQIMDHDPFYQVGERYLLALRPLGDDFVALLATAEQNQFIAAATPSIVLFNGRLLVVDGALMKLDFDDRGFTVPGWPTGKRLEDIVPFDDAETGASIWGAAITRQPTATSDGQPTTTASPPAPVLIQLATSGGDRGDWERAIHYVGTAPLLTIYTDGLAIIREGGWEDGRLVQGQLSTTEMCALLADVARTGFLDVSGNGRLEQDDPIYDFPADYVWGYGAGVITLQVNGRQPKLIDIYAPAIDYLVDEVRAAFELVRDFRPTATKLYLPRTMLLYIVDEDASAADNGVSRQWPAALPSPEEMLAGRPEGQVTLDGDEVHQVMNLFGEIANNFLFQANGRAYSILARPLLPHERPASFGQAPWEARAFDLPFSCDEGA